MVAEIAYSELSIMSCSFFTHPALDLILAKNMTLSSEAAAVILSLN